MSKESLQIDPATGALSIEVPLRTYTGRGGTSIPVSLKYTSKVWRMDYESFLDNQNCDYGPSQCTTNLFTILRTSFAAESSSGWTSGMQMPRVSGDRYFNAQGRECVSGDCLQNPRHINRLYIHMPDGSSREFRKDDAVHTGSMNLTGTYYAVDGTGTRFVRGNPEYTGTLYLNDGSRYVIEEMVNNQERGKYIDASGNTLIYRSEDGGWTDTLGRLIKLPLGNPSPSVGDFNYELPGMSGSPSVYSLKWRKLEDVLTDPSQPLHYTGDRDYTYNYYSPSLFYSDEENRFLVELHNPVVLSEIAMPDGQTYKFTYNVFGEIDKVVFPTGGYERYQHGYVPPTGSLTFPYYQANRGVIFKWVSPTGNSSDEIQWNYNYTGSSKVTQPDGTVVETFFHPGRHFQDSNLVYGFDDARAGKQYEKRIIAPGNVIKRRSLSKWEVFGPVTFNNQTGHAAASRDPYVSKEFSIVFEAESAEALVTLTEFDYDTNPDPTYMAHLNLKRSRQYDYVPANAAWAKDANVADLHELFANQTPKVISESDYLYNESYKARNLTKLATATRIKDGNNNIKSQTEVSFDEAGYYLASSGTMPSGAANSWLDPLTELGEIIGSKRGLPTTVKTYIDLATNHYVTAHNFYDQYGNLRKARDAKNNDTETQYSANYAFAYPTKIISPIPGGNGSNTAFETTTVYNFNTGLPTAKTDANGQTTQMSYADPATGIIDPLLRLRKVTAPNGHQTITEYGVVDSNSGQFPASQRFVKVKSQIDESSWNQSYTWFDGLGRTSVSQTPDSNGDIFTKTKYDNMGRIKKFSNPFRGENTPDEQLEWTENFYDSLSRIIKVKTPDAAEAETTYSLAAIGTEIGTATTVKDQALKEKRLLNNALGQLIRVDEPNGAGQLGTIQYPAQPTLYSYDALNNLTFVLQGEQTRTFVYDSLSRLKSATNPESGTVQYTYDANGNLQTRRDARGIKTVYDYDALNRAIKKCYRLIGTGSLGMTTCAGNDETVEPNTFDVTYSYDASSVANSKGQLTKITTGNPQNPFSTTEYTEFDSMGKIKRSLQTTDNLNIDESRYSYNLSGALIEQTYPSGRVVRNVLNSDGELSIVQSRKNHNAGFWNYAQHFTYTPSGIVSSMQLGNGRWESTTFNSRLQPIQIALGATENAADLLKLDYSYGTWENGNLNQQKNNGNLARQIITVPTIGNNTGFTATQVYIYNSLNQIKQATETIPNQAGWQQTFIYDRYGNRNFDEANTSTLPKNCGTAPNLTVCPADISRFNPAADAQNNRLDGYIYDEAGNTIRDAQNRKFTYDAENRQVKVETVDAGGNVINTVGQYFFDGSGKRVKKYVPATQETTLFLFDASAKLIGEYSANIPEIPKVSYLNSDPLGSPRINTDEYGDVMARHDYQPFGEEINRTTYDTDEIRKQFTGYERDKETNIDFAQARYFDSAFGRFTSPDPLAASATTVLPQSWNRYTYSYNNPLRFTDPSGMIPGDFYNLEGRKIGTDGINDGKVHIVYDEQKAKEIQNTTGNYTGNVTGKVTLPNTDVIKEIGDAVNRSNSPTVDDKKGGFHEEGVSWKTNNGNTAITPASPGAYSNPLVDKQAVITLPADADGKAHVHPKGEIPIEPARNTSSVLNTTVIGGGGSSQSAVFIQPPSPGDIANAIPNGTNIVVGARDKTVYFYQAGGNDSKCNCIAKMKLNNFLKIGGK